jgi:hypothetical protein
MYSNQDIFLDKQYITLRNKVNHSNNESIFLCKNGNFEIITPYDFYRCGDINPNIQLKSKVFKE